MKRKNYRKKLLPVSFFAFQDIISALAGTMLLVVLAVVYERSSQSADAAMQEKSGKPLSEYQNLQKLISRQKNILAGERSQLDLLKSQLHCANQHPSEQTQQLKTQQDIRYLQKLTGERKKLLQLLQNELAQLRRNHSALSDFRQRSELLEKLQNAQQQLFNQQNILKITRTTGKQNLLLDCSRTRWLWQTDAGQTQQLGADLPTPALAVNELYGLLKKHDQSQVRLIVAVRPSAGEFINALLEKLKKDFPALEITAEPMLYENSGGVEL